MKRVVFTFDDVKIPMMPKGVEHLFQVPDIPGADT